MFILQCYSEKQHGKSTCKPHDGVREIKRVPCLRCRGWLPLQLRHVVNVAYADPHGRVVENLARDVILPSACRVNRCVVPFVVTRGLIAVSIRTRCRYLLITSFATMSAIISSMDRRDSDLAVTQTKTVRQRAASAVALGTARRVAHGPVSIANRSSANKASLARPSAAGGENQRANNALGFIRHSEPIDAAIDEARTVSVFVATCQRMFVTLKRGKQSRRPFCHRSLVILSRQHSVGDVLSRQPS